MHRPAEYPVGQRIVDHGVLAEDVVLRLHLVEVVVEPAVDLPLGNVAHHRVGQVVEEEVPEAPHQEDVQGLAARAHSVDHPRTSPGAQVDLGNKGGVLVGIGIALVLLLV